MSEYRKEDSTLEPICIVVDVPALVTLESGAIGTVRLLMTPFHYFGEGRTRGDTVEVDVPPASDPDPGWVLAGIAPDQTLTLTHYPTEGQFPSGFYEYEVWIYDSADVLVLKTPSGRPGILQVRPSLVRAPEESS